MSNVLDDSTMAGQNQRPTFLTVLCILSFIGSPLGLISNVMSYISMSGDDPMTQMILETMAALGISINPMGYLINGVLCLATLFGAFQMWKLKKMGFFIYVGATVVTVVISMIMLGGLAAGGFAVIGIALSALFPILYALNLKHMS